MTQALAVVVGVAIGVALSVGVSYLMAKRADTRRARAAVRLIEDELVPLAALLDELNLENAFYLRLMFCDLLKPPPVWSSRWEEHEALLAEVLSRRRWYALVRAYEAVEILRGVYESGDWDDVSRDFGLGVNTDKKLGWTKAIARELRRDIRRGADVITAIAGGPPPADLKLNSLQRASKQFAKELGWP